MESADTRPAPAYPIARPNDREDPRFSIGLALEVAEVLTRHGYPPVATGEDLLHLQLSLHKTIYQEKP